MQCKKWAYQIIAGTRYLFMTAVVCCCLGPTRREIDPPDCAFYPFCLLLHASPRGTRKALNSPSKRAAHQVRR